MSGEGPESIPTSADPRSRRPIKKRALTPVSAQAASVDALFAKPEQEIRIPHGGPKKRTATLPPEIVTNVQGSSAGAGSGEFHVYKAARRREYERLRIMDEEKEEENAKEEFERKKSEMAAKDDEKTRRNREKREKIKARKEKAKKGKEGGIGRGVGTADAKPAANGGGIKARVDVRKSQEGEEATKDKIDTETKNGQTTETVHAVPQEGLVITEDD